MKGHTEKWLMLRKSMFDQGAILTDEQLLQSPVGLSNNLLWHLGHISRTTEFLLWQLGGFGMKFPENLDTLFAKGSSPSMWPSTAGLKERVFEHENKTRPEMIAFMDEIHLDEKYPEPYVTSTGLELSTFRDGIEYNLFHEGVHFGQFQLYRKLLGLV